MTFSKGRLSTVKNVFIVLAGFIFVFYITFNQLERRLVVVPIELASIEDDGGQVNVNGGLQVISKMRVFPRGGKSVACTLSTS